MIEVFKTNINCPDKARQLIENIQATFVHYKANFDLDDCDRILRVDCNAEKISAMFIHWLSSNGCEAEALPDH